VPLFRWRTPEEALGKTLNADPMFKRGHDCSSDWKLHSEASGE